MREKRKSEAERGDFVAKIMTVFSAI